MTASAASSAMFNLTDSGLPTVLPIFTVPRADDYVCVPRIDCPFVLEEMRTTLGVRNVSPSIGSLLSELFRQEAERLNYTHVTGSRLRLFEPLFLEHDSGLAVPQWFNDDARKEADHLLDLVLYRSGVISDDFVDLTSSIEECGGLDGCPVELIERATKEFRTDSPHELCKIDDVVDDEKDSISFGRSQLLTILLMIATGVFAMLFLATLCLLMRYRPASDSKVEDISTPEFKRTPTSC
ncbi:unnamed protein product [Heligmosomoides polygyrus]|uniref:COesterase domain-containing protein n=1 Tax=Heligmosomoides polygyrus TaxID=6339 RepID=A0A183GA98_HELPZ|nr:unnamed protein product [Heligmosomoides polygyrus]